MDRNQAREAFKEKFGIKTDIGWMQITGGDVYLIAGFIAKELESHNCDSITDVVYEIGKITIRRKKNSNLIDMADIKVNQKIEGCKGWEARQAMTFEPDGFIGFCGWADNNNMKPFVNGFMKWLETK